MNSHTVLTRPQIEAIYETSVAVVAETPVDPNVKIPLLCMVFARALEHCITARYLPPERHARLNQLIQDGLDVIERSTPKE